ncbi:MAG TPA: hypothetical protein VGT61_08350 [Thermomicrobiales bacterium]|jgi:hypothetical protein|nr:hypothetical protein [Thermomicrobiales bacterium]
MTTIPYLRPGWRDPLYPEPSADRLRVEERLLPWLGVDGALGGRRSLAELVAGGSVAPGVASTLARLARSRASLLVIGGPSGCGKTTLLEALLPWYPPADRRIRLRGAGESFVWSRQPGFNPGATVVVAEEISGHLPSYLWGPAVDTFLGLGNRGAALIATAHAEDPAGVVRLLCGYPLRLSISRVATFDVIIGLVTDEGEIRSRIGEAWVPREVPGGGVVFEPVDLGGSPLVMPERLRCRLDGQPDDGQFLVVP